MYFLSRELYFPPVHQASAEGIVAIGGDLSLERLMLAYRSGIFPWFEDDEPILWWSPPERMVLLFPELKISKSMRNIINRGIFKVTWNTAFEQVIKNCRTIKRDGQPGTWITPEMVTLLQATRTGLRKISRGVAGWRTGRRTLRYRPGAYILWRKYV